MSATRELAYRPDPAWQGLAIALRRFDLLGLALGFLAGALALGGVLFL